MAMNALCLVILRQPLQDESPNSTIINRH